MYYNISLVNGQCRAICVTKRFHPVLLWRTSRCNWRRGTYSGSGTISARDEEIILMMTSAHSPSSVWTVANAQILIVQIVKALNVGQPNFLRGTLYLSIRAVQHSRTNTPSSSLNPVPIVLSTGNVSFRLPKVEVTDCPPFIIVLYLKPPFSRVVLYITLRDV